MIVDDDMRPLPAGQVGRLAVRGPTGCRYLANPEQQRKYVRDGWNLRATPIAWMRTAISGTRRAPTT